MRKHNRRGTRKRAHRIRLTIEIEQEDDGRWFADVQEFAGVMSYGKTMEEALRTAMALLFNVMADRIKHGEMKPVPELVTDLV